MSAPTVEQLNEVLSSSTFYDALLLPAAPPRPRRQFPPCGKRIANADRPIRSSCLDAPLDAESSQAALTRC